VLAMMFLGAILFILFFIGITPQTRHFVVGAAAGTAAWIVDWAPISYILLLILVAAPFAGMYIVHTWPQRVDEENPMAKYRRELPLDED
jgi:hypothetical protein